MCVTSATISGIKKFSDSAYNTVSHAEKTVSEIIDLKLTVYVLQCEVRNCLLLIPINKLFNRLDKDYSILN